MPKIKSAKKRLRQTVRRAHVNKIKKDTYKSLKRQIKKASSMGEAGKEKLGELGQKFYQAVDKAAKTGVIHRNKASREKSRITALISPKTNAASKEVKPRAKRAKAAKKTAKAKSAKASRKKAGARKAK